MFLAFPYTQRGPKHRMTEIPRQQQLQEEVQRLRRRVAELEAGEARLRSLLEDTPQAKLIHTDRVLYCNTAAARLFGYDSPEELLALPSVAPLLEPSAREVQQERCLRRLRGEPEPPIYEMQARRKDGTLLWLQVAAQRVEWEGGPAVHCSYSDISDRKRAEDELRTYRRIMGAALDALPLWVAVKDARGRFLLANRGLAGAYDKRSEQMDGLTAAELGSRHPDMLAKVDAIDREVLEHGTTVEQEDYRVMLPDGSEQVRHLIKTPLRDEAGQIIGLVGVSSDVTAQRRAEYELRESRRLLQVVMDSVPLWIILKDRQSRHVLVNRAYADVFGTTPERILGTSPEAFGPREASERAVVSETDQIVWDTGQPLTYPAFPYTLPDGTKQVRHVIKVPLRDEQGETSGLISVSLDITRQRAAEEQLRQSEERLRSLVSQLPIVMCACDAEGVITALEGAGLPGMGWEGAQFIGRSIFNVMAQSPTAQENGRRVLKGEYVQTTWERAGRVFDTRLTPLRDADGQPAGAIMMALDITERVEAEQRQQADRRLLQAVFDAIPSWLFVKDSAGAFLMVNHALARDAGGAPAEFGGMPHDEVPLGTPEQRAEIWGDNERILAEGTAIDRDEDITLPDGRLSVRHVHKVPLRDEEGLIVGIVGISEDITERRVMEEQVRRMQRMEAIGTLAGGIAHDFNNILFPIIGFTELTMQTLEPGSRSHHNLSIVRDAALRAKEIVAQILTFSRRSDNKPEVMRLQPLVRESLRFLRSTLPPTVRVEEDIPPEVPHVHADAVQMHQVLMNLCVNAAHAMPEGGTLKVALREVELRDFRGYTGGGTSGPHVCLSVSDTGEGMDADTLAHIFEPFFTTKPVGQGTGLGLSTVLGMVSQHKGVIDVRSVLGQGATFEIYLPVVAAPVSDETSAAADPAQHGEASILFVDDEPAVTELAAHVLGELGYRVHGYTSSKAALRAFEADPDAFDLVITDQMMPGLTGDKLVQAIRAVRCDVPILLGTGYSEVITPEGARELGIAEVFYKPITPRQLADLVQKTLAPHAAGASKSPPVASA